MRKTIVLAGVCAGLLNIATAENETGGKLNLMSPASWNLKKGSAPTGLTLSGENGKKTITLNPHGKYFSARTNTIPITPELRTRGKIISFKAKNLGVKAYFAILLEFFDDSDAIIGKKAVLYSASPKRKPSDWRNISKTIGKDGDVNIPAKAAGMRLRMAFSPAGKVCEGKVEVENMTLTDAPVGEWPKSFSFECGPIKVSFNAKTYWNISRIDYDGKQMGTENIGYYGTVGMFPKIGFIGSGHKENESEVVISKKLTVDGKEVLKPAESTKCEKVELTKTSHIHGLELKSTVTATPKEITEKVSIKALKPVKLDLLYNFMHPWVLDFSNYIGETLDGKIVEGKFTDDKGFHLNKAVKWSGVYSEKLGVGEVTILPETAKEFKFIVKYWDNPHNNYRKHYFQTMMKAKLKPGEPHKYKAVIRFYKASPKNWMEKAKTTAADM